MSIRFAVAAVWSVCLLGFFAGAASVASADFPYLPATGGNPSDPQTFKLQPGAVPSEFAGGVDWKFSATPEQSTQSNLLINGRQDELCGVRGASIVDSLVTQPVGCLAGTPVRTAWQLTTGQPRVVIAVLDSGIEWNDAQAMTDLRDKVRINQGELPAPRHDLSTALISGVTCASYANATGGNYNPHGNYDVNRDGVFNLRDYACDSRVARAMRDPRRHGPAGMLTPEDLILAFSDGIDHDHNGFANDIAGWNFVDDNNNPYDDVHYGHGTGEALDSNAEANNGGDVGSCPNCMVLPLRVGESFVADVNRFAQAVLYATDNGGYVIQEALGTLNSSLFARQAIDYAYNHGVAVIASAADEAAEHHNPPGSLPHTILVNSVNKYESLTSSPPSYLQLNGCTNFSTKITVSVPSSSCSSEATGKSAGVAGLIYSAALNAIAAGKLHPAADCRRVDGTRCPVTANEVRQLMASGDVGSTAPADAGHGAQADDINFAAAPEPSCQPAPTPSCTDPNLNTTFAPDENGGVVGSFGPTHRYHARRGFDEFFGYGRLDAAKAVAATAAGTIPPQADITAPDWFQQLDPHSASAAVHGYVNARVPYRCRVYVAPGGEPNNALTTDNPPGDFAPVSSSWCDGASVHNAPHGGVLGILDLRALRARFPSNVGDFTGNANANLPQSSNGRPNTLPYAFTVRVVVTTAVGAPMSGEDRRQLVLHRDRDTLPPFPKELQTDGASSPLLVDIDGDNRNELIVATSDGLVHAFRANGSEVPGWPVHTDPLPLHLGGRAFSGGGVSRDHYGAVLGALAAGDLFADGRIEVVADDLQGHVYAWTGNGQLVFRAASNPAYSGAPTAPLQSVRQGPRDRTEGGFLSSPVLASLDGGRRLDIIAAGEDRHVYAWKPNGRAIPGFPVLVADPDKVAAVDPKTNHLTFNSNVDPNPGIDEDQGKIIDTPAVARLNGPRQPPAILIGTNEEYPVDVGDEGPVNFGPSIAAELGLAAKVLKFGNGRLYAIKATGGTFGHAFLPGWPKKVAIVDRGLLPDVGEGINGSPIVAPLSCPNGGAGMKIAVTPDAGPAYVFNPDGSSCYGQSGGQDNPLDLGPSPGSTQADKPAFPAVGYPAFGSFDGHTIDLFSPTTGLTRSLDVQLNEYQGGQDYLGAWDPATGQQLPGYPAEMNDLQFLTGPVIGDILGTGSQQVIGGSASQELAAFNASGAPASSSWPKLTGDWTIAAPTLGSLGTLDSSASARKDVVSITRSGSLSVYSTPASACSPSSWPRYHHDDANSGDYTHDAVTPGRPFRASLVRRVLSFAAPGEDLMCGLASSYHVVTSARPITPQNFAAARRLAGAPQPAAAGRRQSYRLPARTLRYVAIRAVNAAGNIGLPTAVDLGPPRVRTKRTRHAGASAQPALGPRALTSQRPRPTVH
jgi:hypothetical protein